MKEKSNHSTFSNIFFFIKLLFKISPLFVIGEFFMGIIDVLPSRLISVLGIKYIIDVVSKGENIERIFTAVILIAVILIGSKIISLLFREFYWNKEKEKVAYGLNCTLYEKAKELDIENYDNPDFYNSFILTIESSSDNITNLLGLVKDYIGNLMSFVTISGVLLSLDPICLFIVLAFVLAFLPLSKKMGNLQMGRRKDNTEYHRRSDYFQRIFYLQDYAKEVRMNNIHPLLIKRYNEAADDVIENQRRYWKKIATVSYVQAVGVQILGFMFVLPLYLGYCVLVKHSLSSGDFVAVFNGAYSIAVSVNFLTVWAISVFSERGKMIEKYREFLKCDFKIKDGKEVATKSVAEEIELKNVSFTYPENDEPTLSNINIKIKPYEKIALVGYNGAGKTTLTNLLLRLYDVTEGEILIGGKNIKDVTVKSHRNRFAAVFQDFKLFACNVGENVALSDKFSKEKVEYALNHSGFKKELKYGVHTELLREFDNEGKMLSGGESQKIAISRAFYKDCPYIILDEPSANLDPVAEYNLNKAMVEAAKNKTVIFISHRLSTTVIADKIFVLEKGKVIESGSHEELMKKNGTYAYMFNLQAEKYKDETNGL